MSNYQESEVITRTTTTTEVREEEVPKRKLFGRKKSPPQEHVFTSPSRTTKPVYESTSRDGTRLIVSEDVGAAKRNPVAEIASTLGRGERVHNQQIGQVLDKSIESVEMQRRTGRLDDRGMMLARDTEDLLYATERLLYEKNREEQLQDFLAHGGKSMFATAGVMRSRAKGVKAPGREETRQVYDYIRSLTLELLRSGDFRAIVNDILELLRDAMRERRLSTSQPPTSTFVSYPSQPTQFTYTSTPSPPVPRIIRSEFEVKNLNQPEPFVEHVVYRQVPSETPYVPTPVPSPTFTTSTPSFTTQQYENYWEQERIYRERITDRYLDILRRISYKKEYRRAMNDLFRLLNWLSHEAQATRLEAKARPETQQAYEALKDARRILEQFTGKEDMALFRRHMNSLLEDIRSDAELTAFFRGLRTFSTNAVKNPEILNDYNRRNEAFSIINNGLNILHRDEWGYRFRQLLEDARILLDNLRRDTTTVDFTQKLEQFVKDFALNREGKPDLWVMDDSLQQLRLILVPMLKSHLENIPIDRIDMTSHKYDVVLEDLQFHGADIIPDHLDLKIKNLMRVNLQEAERDRMTHKMKLRVDHIAPVLHNVKFYVRKKTGIKYEDYGIVDIALRGEGMCIEIDWRVINVPGQPARVYLHKTKCSIDELQMRFVKEKTKHGTIDSLASKLLNTTIKRRIAGSVAEYLQVKITRMDDQINQFLAKKPIDNVFDKANTAVNRSFTAKSYRERERLPMEEAMPQRSEFRGPPSNISQPYTQTTTQTTTQTSGKHGIGGKLRGLFHHGAPSQPAVPTTTTGGPSSFGTAMPSTVGGFTGGTTSTVGGLGGGVTGGTAQTLGGATRGATDVLGGVTGGTAQTLGGVTGGTAQTLGGVTGGTTSTLGGVAGGTAQTLGGVTGGTAQTLGGVGGGVANTLGGVTGGTAQTLGGVGGGVAGSTAGGVGGVTRGAISAAEGVATSALHGTSGVGQAVGGFGPTVTKTVV